MRFVSDDQVVDKSRGAVLQVLAAGLPRCATSSMEAALDEDLNLGPCMTMAHVLPHVERTKLVTAALMEFDKTKRQKLLHELFDGYTSSADAPGCFFVEDLIEMYPGVKVILNKRSSVEAWERSIQRTIKFFSTKAFLYLTYLSTPDYYHYHLHRPITPYIRAVQGYKGDGDLYSADYYNYFNKMVPQICQRRGMEVLEFEPSMGYEPLCKFLGKPVPSTKFPHRNDEAALQSIKRYMVARGVLAWSVLGGGAFVFYKYTPWTRLFATIRQLTRS